MVDARPPRLGRHTRDNVPFFWPAWEDGKWRIHSIRHEATIPGLLTMLNYHRKTDGKEEDARLYRWFYRSLRPLVPAANAAWQPNRRNGITIHLPEEY